MFDIYFDSPAQIAQFFHDYAKCIWGYGEIFENCVLVIIIHYGKGRIVLYHKTNGRTDH